MSDSAATALGWPQSALPDGGEADTSPDLHAALRRPLARLAGRQRQEGSTYQAPPHGTEPPMDWWVFMPPLTERSLQRAFEDLCGRDIYAPIVQFVAETLRSTLVYFDPEPHFESLAAVSSGPMQERDVHSVFAQATEEWFGEDGLSSDFSKRMSILLHRDASTTLDIVDSVLELATDEVAGETLRWLGAVDHPRSRKQRCDLLERRLRSQSARARYAAAVGLSALDDPNAIPPLREAVNREEHEIMKYHLQRVLSQLENTDRCLHSSG